jgi:N-hydroxyarylamine O-acetyltransferase
MPLDIDSYLRRIEYHGPRTPTAETLRGLHRAHMLAVPFENLDIGLGRPILCDEERFFDKIVRRWRDGFCYELNGLFAALLRALGFEVTLLSARVCDGDVPGPDFDHMALLVQLEDRFLADVGFGDSFIEPLRFDDPGEQARRQDGVAYRLAREGETWIMSERQPNADWTAMFQFTLTPRQLADYAEMCYWQQTSPDSSFTRKRVCSRATPQGRITLSNLKLIITQNGQRQEQALAGEDDFRAALHEYFGMDLT